MAACPEAVDWVDDKDLKTAWNTCERADWMLWLAAKTGIDRKLLVLVACDCAETALKYVPDGEDRPRQAIETARKWCAGEASIDQVRNDAADADDAATAAAVADAHAAYAAAYAAAHAHASYAQDVHLQAAHASYAAAHTAYAAAYAADAAYAAAANAARKKSLKTMSEMVRNRIPLEIIVEVMG
jgi:hypothetical protein